MDALRKISGRYDIADFDLDCLQEHIDHDIQLLKKIQTLVKPITPDKDKMNYPAASYGVSKAFLS
jgi:hypothetical protein